jgi:hypothetical protein
MGGVYDAGLQVGAALTPNQLTATSLHNPENKIISIKNL